MNHNLSSFRLFSTLGSLGLCALLFGGTACDGGEDPGAAGGESGHAERPVATASRSGGGNPDAANTDAQDPNAYLHEKLKDGPKPVAPDAKATFEEMLTLIDEHYVDENMDRDRLYTAAMRGVMDELIQMPGHDVNSLMSPEDFSMLLEGTEGKIVGVGVMIEAVGDLLVVRGAVAGSPGEAAGLQEGDRILAVNGTRVTELGLKGAVDQIRGEAGTKVELFVQRDTEEWTLDIERAPVKVPSVESVMLRDGVGYLRIRGFSKETGSEAKAQLDALAEAGMKGLVLDLRECPGGLLETALEVAELFLAPELPIVSIRGRKGDEDKVAATKDAYDDLPIVAVIGPKTASGAEILSGALQENGRALIVGQQSFGKGTVEAIHKLENGWALKLSAARFFSPNDVARQDNGVSPDFEVVRSEGKLPKPEELAKAPDAEVGAAMRLLEIGG